MDKNLPLFSALQGMPEEKLMTTKELAEVLGVDVVTVKRAAKTLFDSTVEKLISTGGRPTQAFTEEQATAIKKEIQSHHNLATRQRSCLAYKEV